jgi:hypothetical protein
MRIVYTGLNQTTVYTVTVTNTGKVAGDEVVFGFFRPNTASIKTLPQDNPVPKKQLFAFQRVHLDAGESTKVSLTLNSTTLGLVDLDGHRELHAGDYDIVFSRGYGEELVAPVSVEVEKPVRISTFR